MSNSNVPPNLDDSAATSEGRMASDENEAPRDAERPVAGGRPDSNSGAIGGPDDGVLTDESEGDDGGGGGSDGVVIDESSGSALTDDVVTGNATADTVGAGGRGAGGRGADAEDAMIDDDARTDQGSVTSGNAAADKDGPASVLGTDD